MDLETIRKKFDAIDSQIISLLAQRTELSKEIGQYKKNHQLAVHDQKREGELIRKLKDNAKQQDVDEQLVEKIYSAILDNSRQNQENC